MRKEKGIFAIAVMTILSILVTETLVWSDPLDIWHRRDSGTTNNLWNIAYANNLFVAVGDNGTILSSPDGSTWIKVTSGTTNHLGGVAYENGAFFVLGNNGTLLTSTQGSTWIPVPMESGRLYDIVYANGTYVVVGYDYIAKSSNLITWQKSPKEMPSAYTVIFAKGNFFYAGEQGDINISSDGINWTTVLNNGCYISPVMLINDTFYAVGCASGSVGYRSVTGTTWDEISDLVEPNIVYSGLAYGNGILATVGTNGNIRVSTNGLDWVRRTGPSLSTWAPKIAFGNNTFVVVGYGGMIFQSDLTEAFTDNDGDGIGDSADPDDDNDGMPDGWEKQYGLNPLVNDASGDNDGDGYSNILEYKSRTDPTDAGSKPRTGGIPWLPLLLTD